MNVAVCLKDATGSKCELCVHCKYGNGSNWCQHDGNCSYGCVGGWTGEKCNGMCCATSHNSYVLIYLYLSVMNINTESF